MFPLKIYRRICYILTGILFCFVLVLMLYRLGVVSLPVFAQEVDCQGDSDCEALQQQIDDLNKAREMSINATKPLQGQLMNLQAQLKQIQANLQALTDKITQKQQDVEVREDKLAQEQALLDQHVRSYYIRSFMTSPLMMIFSSQSGGNLLQELSYRQAATQSDEQIITSVTQDMVDLVKQKDQLQVDQANLAAFKVQVDKNATFLDGQIKQAQAYQADLSSQIAQLSAKQQAIIAAKLASLNIPLFAYNTQGGCSSDINPYKDPGFSGDKFGLFTYGVPNRVGLNQYGAWGRAKAGQNSDTILHAYYNFDGYQTMNATIRVNDSNSYNSGNIIWSGSLDDYVKRIYEVPDSWTDNDSAALKAQAIAARSYVMAETNNGAKSICATQSCQVFKTDPKGGNWDSAVNATAGQVMVQGGNPITAYFSSTHGGYMYTTQDIGWASTSFTKRGQDASSSISSFSDLNNNAYDKDSPWFYCDWGGRSQYNNTAWLTSSEMADIVNSILLVQNDSSADSHILQTDKSDPDAWSADQVKQALAKYQTPFTSISSASVDADFGSGQTTTVHFSGDGGSADISGNTFRKYFNLRAPSNIQIVGPLFNIEKK